MRTIPPEDFPPSGARWACKDKNYGYHVAGYHPSRQPPDGEDPR